MRRTASSLDAPMPSSCPSGRRWHRLSFEALEEAGEHLLTFYEFPRAPVEVDPYDQCRGEP